MAKEVQKRSLLNLVKEISTNLEYEVVSDLIKPFLDINSVWIKTLLTLKELPSYDECMFSFNMQELIFICTSMEKIIRKLEELQSAVEIQLESKEKMCYLHKIKFKKDLLGNLITHLNCDRNRLLSSQLTTKLQYDEMIQLRLYPPHILDLVRGIEGYNVFSVRLKRDNMVECMVCDYTVSQTKLDNLWNHVCDLIHLRRLELHYQNLLKYHAFWMMQKPRDQEIQLNYKYFNDKEMRCIKCKEKILFNDILLHLKSCAPIHLPSRGKYIPPRDRKHFENLEQPVQVLPYSKEVETTLYCALPHLDMDGIQYPIMQRLKEVVICIICNVEVLEAFNAHCDGDSHTFNQSNFVCTQTLKEYHDVWSSLHGTKQMQQVYFRRDEFEMVCVLCYCYIEYNVASVEEHINLLEHMQKLNSIRNSKVVEAKISKQVPNTQSAIKISENDASTSTNGDCFTHINKKDDTDIRVLPYTAETFKKLFEGLPHVLIDGAPYPTMRKEENNIYCLLCNRVLEKSLNESPKNHHHKKTNSDLKSLQQYHDLWSAFPSRFETEQLHFKRVRRGMACQICSIYLSYTKSHIRQHLLSKKHKTGFTEWQQIHHYVVEEKDKSVSSHTQPIPNLDTLIHLMDTEIYQLNNKPSSSVEDTQVCMSKSNADLERQLLYSNLPYVIVENKQYPILQRINNNIFCLLCNKDVSGIVSEHMNAALHCSKERKHFPSLKVYHDIWNSLPVNIRSHELYFRRYRKVMKCSLCFGEDLPYDASVVSQHIKSRLHQNNYNKEILEEKDSNINKPITHLDASSLTFHNIIGYHMRSVSNLDKTMHLMDAKIRKRKARKQQPSYLSYARTTVESIFRDLPYTSINGVEYPFMYYIGKNVFCQICKTDFKKPYVDHLKSASHVKKARNQADLAKITLFHKLWSNLPGIMQPQLIHFRMKKKMSCMLCRCTVKYVSKIIEKHLVTPKHMQELSKWKKERSVESPKKLKVLSDDVVSKIIKTCKESSASNINDSEIKRNLVSTDSKDLSAETSISLSISNCENILEISNTRRNSAQCTPTLKDDCREFVFEDSVSADELKSSNNMIVKSPVDIPESTSRDILSDNLCKLLSYDLDLTQEVLKRELIDTDKEYRTCLISSSTSKAEYLSDDNFCPSPVSDYTSSIGTPDTNIEDFYSENDLDYYLEEDIYEENLAEEKENETSPIEDAKLGRDDMDQRILCADKIGFPSQSNTPYHLKVPTIFPSYHSSISDALYGSGLIHYNIKLDDVKYPMIQNIGPYKHCLICAQSLSSELFHCNSESHINNLQNPQSQFLLRKYHNVFVQLPINFQIQQKYFRKEEQLRCILCSVSIPYDPKFILTHVQTLEHIIKQERFEASPSTSRNSSPTTKHGIGTPTKKKASPKKSQNRDVSKSDSPKNKNTGIIVENGSYNLMHFVTTNIESGTIMNEQYQFQKAKKGSSKQTTQSQRCLDYLPAVKEKLFKDLHEYTVTVDDKDYFLLRHSMLGVRCILCNDGPATNPEIHVKTNNHLKHMENKTPLYTLKAFHNIWMVDTKIQEHQFYVVQKHCRLCQVTIHDDQIKKHVLSSSHLKNVSDYIPPMPDNGTIKTNGEIKTHITLSSSATTSTDLEPRNDNFENGTKRNHITPGNNQVQSETSETTEISLNYISWIKETIYYALAQYTITLDNVRYPYMRRTWLGLTCILCEDIVIDEIAEHINSENHIRLMEMPSACKTVQDFHDFWTEGSPYNQNQQIYFINRHCTLCCEGNDDDAWIRTHIYTKEHKEIEDSLTVQNLLENMGIGDKFQYCIEAQSAFYEELDDYCTYYGTIQLPLLRQTNEGKRCILCDDAGVTIPKQHIETANHKQALKDIERLEKLRKFHKMWQNMSPKAQMQQQYVILMMCTVCDKKLSVDTAEAHVLSRTHKGNVTLKQHKPAKSNTEEKHNVRESAINPKSQYIHDQLPSYLSYQLKVLSYVTKEYDETKCTPCNKVFKNVIDLRHHLDCDSHHKLSKLQQFKAKFFCEICVQEYCSDGQWLGHLSSTKHFERTNKLGDSRKTALKEHFCHTCQTIIFGDTISLLRHGRNTKTEKDVKVSLNKALKKLLSSQKYIIDTAEELLKLSENEMEESESNVKRCCFALENALSIHYPNCKAYPFGSRITGLGNNNSDLDVFIDIGGVYDGSRFQSAAAQADIVGDVGDLLRRQKKQFSHVHMVPSARTPIVQVLHNETAIDCDISFRHGLSVENTSFIKYCLEIQPKTKPAMLFLKDWLVKSDLPYGTLTSYALTLLFIFFLQSSNYLLSVANIRKLNMSKGPIIDGWEAITYTQREESKRMQPYVDKCNLSIPQLLEMFFSFYSNFDFNNSVICPLLGQTLPKYLFHPRRPNLPSEMSTYIKKLNSANPEIFKSRTAMCVQDPFDLSHNVTKACSDVFVKTFQKFCQLSKCQISALK